MHIDIDRFADLESPIHRWDPRFRIVGVGGLIVAIASTRTLEAASVGLALAAIIASIAKIPMAAWWRRLRWVFVILAPLAVAFPLVAAPDGRVEGASRGGALLVRGLAIVLLAWPLLGTSRVADTFAALAALRVPRRLAELFLFSYRYLFVLLDDRRRARLAMRVKGYAPKGLRDLPRRMRVEAAQMSRLLLISLERTERIRHAMVARGFRGEFRPRRHFQSRPLDFVKTLTVLALGVGLTWWDR